MTTHSDRLWTMRLRWEQFVRLPSTWNPSKSSPHEKRRRGVELQYRWPRAPSQRHSIPPSESAWRWFIRQVRQCYIIKPRNRLDPNNWPAHEYPQSGRKKEKFWRSKCVEPQMICEPLQPHPHSPVWYGTPRGVREYSHKPSYHWPQRWVGTSLIKRFISFYRVFYNASSNKVIYTLRVFRALRNFSRFAHSLNWIKNHKNSD